MSSNIRINKVCEQCGNVFEARKLTTRTCSDSCAKKAYKARERAKKLQGNNETVRPKLLTSTDREFLTVKDMAKLLQCSKRTAYYLISKGSIKSINLAQRKTLIKRSEIDRLFE